MTARGWQVVGVPSSAAAHTRGLERAPAALRAAGLLDSMRGAGLDVQDDGDLPEAVWRPHRRPGEPNDIERVADGVQEVRRRTAAVLARGRTPLVLGGECTVAIGVAAAAAEVHGEVALVYVDGGQDLQLPADHPQEPILDSMGVAHMLDLPGACEPLAAAGPRRPLLDAARVVFFGYHDDDEDTHGQVRAATRIPAAEVAANPAAAARRALEAVGSTPYVLHVDVDVLDFLALPVADVPSYGDGLSPDVLGQALHALASAPGLVAMTFVELNPDHAGEAALREVVSLLTRAVAAL